MSRVAFIGNLAFLTCGLWNVVAHDPFTPGGPATSVLFVLGVVMSFWLNLVVCVWAIVAWRTGKLAAARVPPDARVAPVAHVPSWLIWTNGAFCLLQLIDFFIL